MSDEGLLKHDPQHGSDLLNHAPAALVQLGLDGVIHAHNSLLPMWLGESETCENDLLIGRNIVDWLAPAGKLHYETAVIPRLLQVSSVREVMIDVRTSRGDSRAIMMNANYVPAGGETPPRIYLALVDSTERILFEQGLLEAKRDAESAQNRLQFLQKATSRLAIANGMDDLGEVLADAAADATQAAWSCAVLLAPGQIPTGLPGCTAAKLWGSAPKFNFSVFDFVITHEAEVYRNFEELRHAFPQHIEELARFGIEAMKVTPLTRTFDDGRPTEVIGAMLNWFRRSRTLESDAIESLKAVAAQAELVVEHLTLQDQLHHRALHDGLTGLANRVLVETRLRQIIASAKRTGEPCGVLFLDLDGFKAVNDQLGHLSGDEVLRIVAERLREVCRPSETVSRLGGDEFVVIGEQLGVAAVTEIGHRIIEALHAPMTVGGAACPISSSVGAVVWQPSTVTGAPTETELIAAADSAMYDAKRAGKAQLVVRQWSPAPGSV